MFGETPTPTALPMPEPAAVELLARMLPGTMDVATSSNGVTPQTLPFLRVTVTGDREAPTDWERTPILQVDVWAETETEAAELATFLAYAWPLTSDSETGDAYISGAWVEQHPRLLTSTPTAEPPRYILSLGFRIHSRSPV